MENIERAEKEKVNVIKLIKGTCYRFFYSFSLVWKSTPFLLILMVLIAIIQGVVPVVSSLISKQLTNTLQLIIVAKASGEEVGAFFDSNVPYLVLFLFTFRALARLATRLHNFCNRIIGEQVIKTVRLIILEKSKQIDISAYDTPEFYEKLENANREAGTRPVTILQNTFTMLSNAISMTSYLVILMSAIPWAGIAIIVVTLPSAIVNFIFRKKNASYIRMNSKGRREMNYFADRSVNKDVVKEIRIFGLTDTFIASYKKAFANYYKGLKDLIVMENGWQIFFIMLSIVTNCICYLYIASQVFYGNFLIGDFTLYTAAITTIAGEITTLINTSATVYEGTLFIDNLITFLNEEPKVVSPEKPAAAPTRGTGHSIEFCDVSFSYPGFDKKVLSHVNLKINAGDNVTLVGLNGAGKTTLIKLMTRLYDPTEGKILLDGIDLKEYDTKDLYDLFGIIFQDFGRYAYSVAENIHFGDIGKTVDQADLERAARSANAHDFISELTSGYDTPLTRAFEKDGTELSGGQWQKIAIARAFYGMKDVLILDEPTAALDPIAENEIYNEFTELSEGKTTLFVSHRLSSAVNADKIVVMEFGEIVEEGTHAELMALEGKYYNLFSTQANRYIDDQSKKTHI